MSFSHTAESLNYGGCMTLLQLRWC